MLPTLVSRLVDGYKVDVVRTLVLRNSLLLATPLGVPLTFNVSSVAVVKLDGRVQLDSLPSSSSAFDNIKLHVDVQPRSLYAAYLLTYLQQGLL